MFFIACLLLGAVWATTGLFYPEHFVWFIGQSAACVVFAVAVERLAVQLEARRSCS